MDTVLNKAKSKDPQILLNSEMRVMDSMSTNIKADKNSNSSNRLKEFLSGSKPAQITTLASILMILVSARLLLSLIRRCALDADCYAYWSDYLTVNNWKDFYKDISYAIYGPVYLYFMWITGLVMKAWPLFLLLINLPGSLLIYHLHKKNEVSRSTRFTPVLYSYLGLIITSAIVLLFLSSSDPLTIKGYMIKMWYVLFDILGGILIYKISKKFNKEGLGILVGSIYILNPGIFVNSSIWGQLDTMIASMMLLSIYLLCTGRKLPGIAMVVISVMTKPQSIVVLPVAGILFLTFLPWSKIKKDKLQFAKESFITIALSILTTLVMYTALFIPFYNPSVSAVSEGSHFGNIFAFAQDGSFLAKVLDFFPGIPSRYFSGVGHYAYATANAFNLWTLFGGQTTPSTKPFWGLTYNSWGTIFFFIVILLTSVFLSKELLKKDGNRMFAACFAVFFINTGFFTLYTNIHERYLLPSIIFAMVCIIWDRRFIFVSLLVSISSFINQYYIYYLANSDKNVWVAKYDPLAVITAIITVAAMLYSIYLLFHMASAKRKTVPKTAK